MPLYRAGTAETVAGTTAVTGVSTQWGMESSPGDLLLVGGQWREIVSIESDTHLTTDVTSEGTLSGPYLIIRSVSTANNLYLMRKVNEFLADRKATLGQLEAQLPEIESVLASANAQLAALGDLIVFTASAATSETNAAASEASAATSETNSAASKVAAATSETNAAASKDAAATSAAAALASKNAAASSETASATNAATSVTSAGSATASKDAAATSAAAALASKDAAASSAAEASALVSGGLINDDTPSSTQVWSSLKSAEELGLKQPALGFTPARQSGANVVEFGGPTDAPTLKVGAEAHGNTWPINIGKNAATATKLAAQVPINGKLFDGSSGVTIGLADIPGALDLISRPIATALAYNASGQLATVTDTINGAVRVTTLTYNPDGTLQKTVAVMGTLTRTETLTYTAGVLTSTTTSEVYA
jgi:hypothetical protein